MAASVSTDADLPDRKPARRGHFDNRELSTIAMLATLHFAASATAALVSTLLYALLGPFAIFVDGVGAEAIPCLLLATALMLVPRVGTASLTIAVVASLNGVVGGSFAVSSLILALVSMLVHETVLAGLGVTTGSSATQPSAQLPTSLVVRTTAAIGIANAVALYMQFYIYIKFYDYVVALWFVHAASLIVGFFYGAIGAAVGTVWGFRLRRTAP